MKMFKELLENGWSLTTLFTLGVTYICWEALKALVQHIKNKITIRPPTMEVFQFTIDKKTIENVYSLLIQNINNTKLSCKVRRNLFIRLMSMRCESHKEQMIKLVETDFNKMSHEEFKIMILKFFSNSHKQWITLANTLNVNESAITLFFKNVEILKDVTEIWMSDICDSSGIWGTNNNKIVIMIRYLLSFEEMYIMKLENTVQQLNGEISSVIIDDVKCDHCIPNCQFPSWRVKYKFNFPQWVNRILIVDDAKYMCDLIKVNLKRNGIDCIVAINKEMAMDAIVNLKVDACILDANLGNESGNELELPLVAAGIPFIYYTGAPDTVSPHVNVPIVLKTTDIQEAFKKLVQVCEEKASMKAD